MSGPDPIEAGSGNFEPLDDPATDVSPEAEQAEPEEAPSWQYRFFHSVIWRYLLGILALLLLLGLGGMLCSPVYWRF
jgi:hypothetical protein